MLLLAFPFCFWELSHTFHYNRTTCSSLNKPLCSFCLSHNAQLANSYFSFSPKLRITTFVRILRKSSTWFPAACMYGPFSLGLCVTMRFCILSSLLDSWLLEGRNLFLSPYPAERWDQMLTKFWLNKLSRVSLSGQLYAEVGSFSNLEINLNKWESPKWLIRVHTHTCNCPYTSLYPLVGFVSCLLLTP